MGTTGSTYKPMVLLGENPNDCIWELEVENGTAVETMSAMSAQIRELERRLSQAKAENDRLTTAMRFIADNAMKGHILKCLKEDDVDLDGNYIHGEYIFVREFAQAALRQEPTT